MAVTEALNSFSDLLITRAEKVPSYVHTYHPLPVGPPFLRKGVHHADMTTMPTYCNMSTTPQHNN